MENMKDTTNSSRPEDLSGSGIYDNADSYFGGNFSANINVPLDNDAATVPDGPYEIDGLDSSQQLPEYNDSQYPETGNNKKDGGKEGSKFISCCKSSHSTRQKPIFILWGRMRARRGFEY